MPRKKNQNKYLILVRSDLEDRSKRLDGIPKTVCLEIKPGDRGGVERCEEIFNVIPQGCQCLPNGYGKKRFGSNTTCKGYLFSRFSVYSSLALATREQRQKLKKRKGRIMTVDTFFDRDEAVYIPLDAKVEFG